MNEFYRCFVLPLPGNIIRTFKKENIFWHLGAIILTAFITLSGFDWWYFLETRFIGLPFIFPGIVLGGILPILVPVGLFIAGLLRKSFAVRRYAYAFGQAALIGSIISSTYKALTGRIQPDLTNTILDISNGFQFGFLNHGIFWGWPSSHTTIAFSMAVTLIVLVPKNRFVHALALTYALYIGLAVSVSIHWFSDFVAGALIGTVIGIVVGRYFIIQS